MNHRGIAFLIPGTIVLAVFGGVPDGLTTGDFAVMPLATPLFAADERPAATAAADEERAKKRLEFMFQAIKKYRVEVGEDEHLVSELHDKPLLRWNNAVSDTQDAIAAVFSRGGRPDVLLQFHIVREDFVIHEFSKITTAPLTIKRGNGVIWKPAETWIKFGNLSGAPQPAKTAALRIAQMRKQAERFDVTDEFVVDQVPTRNHLRLLAQPIFRYSDAEKGGDIVDGAVFSFALGTDPEANLLVEIHKDGDKKAWRYALAPMTIYALEGKLDDAIVWTKPVYKDFCNPAAGYYVCPFRSDVGENGVKGLLR
jgi:hypothetical protein